MKFLDVTDKRSDIVTTLRLRSGGKSQIRVYENSHTLVIYEVTDSDKHLSISNDRRSVKEKEIVYCVEKIMKVKYEEIKGYLSPTNVLHLHWNTENQVNAGLLH